MTRLLALALVPLLACHPAAPATPRPAPAAAATTPAAFGVRVVGHGPPIVFIPGLSSPGWVWDATVAQLATRYTCHVLTLAGFADQPARPRGDGGFLAGERDAILAYLDANHLARVVIVGHSLGGTLAFALAARAPDRVAGVLAIDGAPFLGALQDPAQTPASVAPIATQIRAQLAGMDRAAFAHQTEAAMAAMVTDPALAAKIGAAAVHSDPATVGDAVYDVMTTDLRPALADVPAPLWLVAAGEANVAAYEAQLAKARVHKVVAAPSARHFVMLDAPALVDATLGQLLAEVAW